MSYLISDTDKKHAIAQDRAKFQMTNPTKSIVPVIYADREYAKQLGAKWNPNEKIWTVQNMKVFDFMNKLKELKRDTNDKERFISIYKHDDEMYKHTKNGMITEYDNRILKETGQPYIIERLDIIYPKAEFLEFSGVYKVVHSLKNLRYYVGTSHQADIILSLMHHDHLNSKNIIYNACLNNNDIIEYYRRNKELHIKEGKDNRYCIDYQWFIEIERKLNYYQYKGLDKLKKHFIKDVSNIIMDYVIKI